MKCPKCGWTDEKSIEEVYEEATRGKPSLPEHRGKLSPLFKNLEDETPVMVWDGEQFRDAK